MYTARGFDVGFPDLFRKKRHSADFIFKRNARFFDNIFMYYTTYVRKCKEKRQKLLPVRDHSEPDSLSSIMNTVPSQIALLRSFCGSDCRLYNKTPSDRSLFFTNPNEISRKKKLCGVFAGIVYNLYLTPVHLFGYNQTYMNTIRTIGKKIPQIRITPRGKSAAINYITVKEK